ncbi:MAG: hypothetical protein IPH28_23420 [Cytophagaceae bacterium]|nr:hypothetical protein [Cytophagaceae bacterium]
MPAFGMRLILFTCIFLIFFASGRAQHSRLTTNSTLSISLGSSTYYGDLSPYRYPFRGIIKSSSFNGAISLTRELNERWAHQLDFAIYGAAWQ